MTIAISGTTGITLAGQFDSASSMGFKNRIINGAMVIDQRNAGASVTVNSSTELFPVDRFVVVGQPSDGVFTAQQSSTAPAGFTKSLLITVTTADASIGASQFYLLQHRIEGFNTADLGFGTASAKTVALSFWVQSSLTGTFGGSLRNATVARSYPFSYTISVANTWEYKTVIITGDTSGTWNTSNDSGINVTFSLGDGSSRLGTSGAWAASNFSGATGQTNLIGTSGATFYITGVQLEKGSTATSFDYRPFGTELALCQRYFYLIGFESTNAGLGSGFADGSSGFAYGALPVTMRATPTLSYIGTLSNINFTHTFVSASANSIVNVGTGSRSYVLQIGSATASTVNAGIYARVINANTAVTFSSEL
jgi:hypothetical protein